MLKAFLLFPNPDAYLYLTGIPVSDTHMHTHGLLCVLQSQTKLYSRIWTQQHRNFQIGRDQMILTVSRRSGGYSLACSGGPVRGSPLWCRCRYTGPGRHPRYPWAKQRASPATSRGAAWPGMPPNASLSRACSPALSLLLHPVLQHLAGLSARMVLLLVNMNRGLNFLFF